MDYLDTLEKHKKIKKQQQTQKVQPTQDQKFHNQLKEEAKKHKEFQDFKEKLHSNGSQSRNTTSASSKSGDPKAHASSNIKNDRFDRQEKYQNQRDEVQKSKDMLKRADDLRKQDYKQQAKPEIKSSLRGEQSPSEQEKQRQIEFFKMNANAAAFLSGASLPITSSSQQTQKNNVHQPSKERSPKGNGHQVSSQKVNHQQQPQKERQHEVINRVQKQAPPPKQIRQQEKPRSEKDILLNKRIEEARREQKLKEKMLEAEARQKIRNNLQQQRYPQHDNQQQKFEHKKNVGTKDKQKLVIPKENKAAQIWCAKCNKKHDADYHAQKAQQKATQNMRMDHDSKEMKQTVNIIDVSSRPIHHKPNHLHDTRHRPAPQQRSSNGRPSSNLPVKPSSHPGKPMSYHDKISQQTGVNRSRDNLGKRSKRRFEDEEDESDLSFVVRDDEVEGQYDPLDPGEDISKLCRGLFRRNPVNQDYGYDSYASSDMEAGYSSQEEEERMAAKIAAKEDRMALLQIQEDEKLEKLARKKRRQLRQMRDSSDESD